MKVPAAFTRHTLTTHTHAHALWTVKWLFFLCIQMNVQTHSRLLGFDCLIVCLQCRRALTGSFLCSGLVHSLSSVAHCYACMSMSVPSAFACRCAALARPATDIQQNTLGLFFFLPSQQQKVVMGRCYNAGRPFFIG